MDVRCGNNLDKVLVCHVPEGNTSKQHNVCVSVSAVATHLASGDYLGVCGGQITQPVITDVKLVEFTVDAMPNPSISFFTLKLNSTSDLPIKMRVTDMWGRVLETRDNLTPGSTIELGSRYRAGAYFVELIQGLEMAPCETDQDSQLGTRALIQVTPQGVTFFTISKCIS